MLRETSARGVPREAKLCQFRFAGQFGRTVVRFASCENPENPRKVRHSRPATASLGSKTDHLTKERRFYQERVDQCCFVARPTPAAAENAILQGGN